MLTSIDNPKIKALLKLKASKERKKENKFIVEGPHLVKEARNLNLLIEAYSIEEKEGYIQISKQIMDKIADTDTTVTEIGLCKMLNSNLVTDKILILDKVQDPGNLGAIMRSANAFGFKTIALGEGTCDIYNSKVIRSSQGAIFKLNFINVNIVEFLKKLNDYDIYGTNVINGIELDNVKKTKKMAIILGNEGNGISVLVNNALKKNIYIPMENTESLNVAIAASIIMYKLR
jgi:TrmH family RNA methyltransferase